MNFQKTSSIIWLTAFSASLFFLAGCGGTPVTLGFPLSDGNAWTYAGTVTYKIGRQEQQMPPLVFKLICRQLGGKRNLPFELTLKEESETMWSVQVANTPHGILNPATVEIWLPTTVKTGKRWNITVDGTKTTLIVRSQTSTTVPAGTFPTYLIDFIQRRKGRGSLWLDPNVGIVALEWSSRMPGGESKLHLELSSDTLLQE